ncbi:hypothetical protein SKAU_G00425180 [Synaphobranchus kaupii]|uniref:Uncharacterized protein n=1 Tax=Synaphobranchus kaupii TaxID=118154 RepID=A0A9Q1IAQ5_SYNKA|nr:hypothetical protein SKAU_G00425180 [Synaphobranchus kaupii]
MKCIIKYQEPSCIHSGFRNVSSDCQEYKNKTETNLHLTEAWQAGVTQSALHHLCPGTGAAWLCTTRRHDCRLRPSPLSQAPPHSHGRHGEPAQATESQAADGTGASSSSRPPNHSSRTGRSRGEAPPPSPVRAQMAALAAMRAVAAGLQRDCDLPSSNHSSEGEEPRGSPAPRSRARSDGGHEGGGGWTATGLRPSLVQSQQRRGGGG